LKLSISGIPDFRPRDIEILKKSGFPWSRWCRLKRVAPANVGGRKTNVEVVIARWLLHIQRKEKTIKVGFKR
jgi:hypothetical protein